MCDGIYHTPGYDCEQIAASLLTRIGDEMDGSSEDALSLLLGPVAVHDRTSDEVIRQIAVMIYDLRRRDDLLTLARTNLTRAKNGLPALASL